MNFDGTIDVTFGDDVDLSAGSFSSDGGAITLNAQDIAFTNEMGAPVPAATAGSGSLSVNANEIDFGTGSKTVNGFGSVTMSATGGIVGQGTGTFDFGALPITLNAPIYLADTSSQTSLTTTGTLNLNANQGTALALSPVGGAIAFIAGSLNDNGATIEAPAGNVSLEATSGDLTIASGSLVSSQGVAKLFFDVTEFAPAGNINLTADQGSINVAQGATLNFAGAQGGGAAGSLTLSAPDQVVNLNGTILGSAAAGNQGGSFALNTGGSVDLDNLASELAQSGVTQSITVETNQGNLILSANNTLTALNVSLTADGGSGDLTNTSTGNVNIFGTINAAGLAGGSVDLYGKNNVDIEGSLIAVGVGPTEQGGTVTIGTAATFNPTNPSDPANYNSTYGYENMATSGGITLGGNALIDVSGGLSNGTVNFRAPLLADGSVNITINPFAPGKGIVGSSATTLEAYAVWSTTDATPNAAQHFDGIVDPTGWYNNAVVGAGQPAMVAGTWTDQKGNTLPAPTADQLASYLANDFFTPTAANTDHETFYGYVNGDPTQGAGTLMSFVQNFQVTETSTNGFGNLANASFTTVPGIELDNPTPATGATSVNNGNISILTNWNLGAGSSPSQLAFRVKATDAAPIITFRAENDVKVDASLSDGFFQIENPTAPPLTVIKITAPTPEDYSAEYTAFFCTSGGACSNTNFIFGSLAYYNQNYWSNTLALPALPTNPAFADPAVPGHAAEEIAQYYGLYQEYLNFVTSTGPDATGSGSEVILSFGALSGNFNNAPVAGQPLFTESAPTAAQELASPNAYVLYLSDYETYITKLSAFITTHISAPFQVVAPVAPPVVLTTLIQNSTTTIGTVPTDNTPSPVATSTNGLPLLQASLIGGASSSFRLVAGADLPSADPLALQAASLFDDANTDQGSVTLNGHFGFVASNGLTLLAPTMIRTGIGSIDIAAGNDVALLDPAAPGVIYTAGEPTPGAPTNGTASIVNGNASLGKPDTLVAPAVNPEAGGDISISAQNDITGIEDVVDSTGAVSGFAGTNISQFWSQWMQTGNLTGLVGLTNPTMETIQTSINFGAFDQGVMSVGGNVSVSAGGNITNLAVSLPTTWYLTNTNTDNPTVNIVGGGNLTVTAGGNILSGDYFVGNGTGSIVAGGQIAPDFSLPSSLLGAAPIPVAMLLATQDGVLNVNARQGVNIGGVSDPSPLQSYSSTSAVNVASTTGDIEFGTLGSVNGFPQTTSLPATVNLTAFTGGITLPSGGTLAPSPSGELSLIADQSINLSDQQNGSATFGMSDANPADQVSPIQPTGSTANEQNGHDDSPLHANDTAPVRIYSLSGSIINGVLESIGGSAGFYDKLVDVAVDKSALIEAGGDIVNLAFEGQNLRDADVTRIVAGRDIVDTPLLPNANAVVPSLVLGGPGSFDIEAGRNIGPLTNQDDAFIASGSNAGFVAGNTGIDAIGNADNPNLPHASASIQVLFGVAPGIDDPAFIANYIDPATADAAGVPSATPALIAFMEQYDEGQGVDTGLVANAPTPVVLTASQAFAQFQTLPNYVQQLFIGQVFFDVLTDVGNDFHNPSSPFANQYARGFQAINTLFPASFGYTANNLGGGSNGSNAPVSTGNLDIRSTTIQTQQGGSVSILGPGGEALVGSSSAPPAIVNANGQVVAGPGTMGILTLEQGDINIFTDESLLLAQSRVFTEQGGNITIWSSNGDINAGQGSTTVANIPPPQYVCDVNHFCALDTKGEVAGAGIGTLQTIPGAPRGNANLLAPRGTVDAGQPAFASRAT